MKRIATVTALILIFAFFVTCACGLAYAQSGAGYFTLFARFFARHSMAAALILPAAAVYYLLALLLVNAV